MLSLYMEVERLRDKRALEELANMPTDKDLEAISRSSREFRERFALK